MQELVKAIHTLKSRFSGGANTLPSGHTICPRHGWMTILSVSAVLATLLIVVGVVRYLSVQQSMRMQMAQTPTPQTLEMKSRLENTLSVMRARVDAFDRVRTESPDAIPLPQDTESPVAGSADGGAAVASTTTEE